MKSRRISCDNTFGFSISHELFSTDVKRVAWPPADDGSGFVEQTPVQAQVMLIIKRLSLRLNQIIIHFVFVE